MTSPLLTLLRTVDTALDEHADTAVFGLDDAELTEARELVHRIGNRIDETELRLAHQTATRDRDAKTAWVRATRQTPRACGARLTLAAALDTREPLRTAMAHGHLSEPQAKVVVATLDQLPSDLPAELHSQAEAHLIDLCADHDPDQLRRLGRHLLRVVAPDRAEAPEAAAVDAEYRRAIERRRLELWDRGDGTYAIKGVLTAPHGHLLDKLLTAWAAPKHQRATHTGADATDGLGERLDAPQRRAAVFCELLERLPAGQMPHAGGVSARVVVDLSLDDLTARLTEAGVATLDGTVDLPAREARRMACEAGILPVVLGGKSEVLDLGRDRRLHNGPQRTGIHRRDKTCRAQDCDWPAWRGHVHHPRPWSRGGHTDMTDMTGMSLCPHHHARAHDPTYEMRTGKHGKVIFSRR
ncbi:HNH endonuclease [Nocardioides mangrovicus]|uniref:HNH endonuclease n=1 Tax=Nocardioides mangrovicus TaxID=2478913 RepID=A0A3L8NZY5_9ACTN|nr:HNH endonuclease signature motif containing protein [Nocardioides mangrovicus]RLV48227.1 HNH endonuclease [Nocardioides mangrovicus]